MKLKPGLKFLWTLFFILYGICCIEYYLLYIDYEPWYHILIVRIYGTIIFTTIFTTVYQTTIFTTIFILISVLIITLALSTHIVSDSISEIDTYNEETDDLVLTNISRNIYKLSIFTNFTIDNKI